MSKTLLCIILLFAVFLSGLSQADQTEGTKTTTEQINALIKSSKANLVFLPGGTFMMGDWGDPESGLPFDYKTDSKPPHKVTLDGFSIMKYKVTYAEFDLFTAAKGLPKVDQDEFSLRYRGEIKPAGVSWFGAKAYCQWLAKLTKLPFDLPTEAQWEYAARSGGKKYLMATDNGVYEPGRNYPSYDQLEKMVGERTALIIPVGKFPPNPIGIYGMNELTREWVNDWYDPKYYKGSPVNNPKGPTIGTRKVQRGDFGGAPEGALVFDRSSSSPTRDDSENSKNDTENYSSLIADNFRCVINKSSRVK